MAFHKGSLKTERDKNLKNKLLKKTKSNDYRISLSSVNDKDGNDGIRLKFYMDDILHPAPRPRFSGQTGSFYNPDKSSRDYIKKIIKELLEEEIGNTINEFSIDDFPLKNVYCKITLNITQVPPKSESKKNKLYSLLGWYKYTKKPDIDNVLKEFMDICNNVIIVDDSSVIEAHLFKTYAYKQSTSVTLDIIENKTPEGRLTKEETKIANEYIEKIVYKEEKE
jgi:Holliday junction resolvase RusA-like endonuclease